MPGRSAITETPVEIWTEIIVHLLDNPVLFRTDPFYPGCNLHSALAEWYDWSHVEQYKKQRGILRLVSQSWKNLVDSRFGWFLEHSTERVDHISPSETPTCSTQSTAAVNAIWKSARRIHIDSHIPNYDFRAGPRHATWASDWPHCTTVYHLLNHHYYSSIDITNTIQRLSQIGPLSVEILILGSAMWTNICKLYSQATLGRLFANVRALEIPRGRPRDIQTPSFLPNLVYLNVYGVNIHETQYAHFPHLITLRVTLDDDNFGAILGWDLPQLQHLDISANDIGDPDLFNFIRKGWPHLITFKCDLSNGHVRFDQDIWDAFPRLQHLSCGYYLHIPHGLTFPPEFPLHTVSFLSASPGWSEEKGKSLVRLISYLPNLKTVAEYYSWRDVKPSPPPSNIASDNSYGMLGFKDAQNIIKMNIFCTSHHLRYEDIWGRTLEEFESIHSV